MCPLSEGQRPSMICPSTSLGQYEHERLLEILRLHSFSQSLKLISLRMTYCCSPKVASNLSVSTSGDGPEERGTVLITTGDGPEERGTVLEKMIERKND